MAILTPEQLTGRVGNHVQQVPPLAVSLHPQAANALLGLAREAASQGIDLQAASAFRSFDRQLQLWNAKFRGELPLLDGRSQPLNVATLSEEARVRAILTWSALPGASRHHWGSDVDVFDRAALAGGMRPQLLPGEYMAGGSFARLTRFLTEHAAGHGFFWPYDQDRGGVQAEPWHLSFAPLAAEALPALSLKVLAEALPAAGLEGAAAVKRLLPEIHERYVCRVALPAKEVVRARGAAGA